MFSLYIVTKCISDHKDTNKGNKCLNEQETLNITSCPSFFNFVKKNKRLVNKQLRS